MNVVWEMLGHAATGTGTYRATRHGWCHGLFACLHVGLTMGSHDEAGRYVSCRGTVLSTILGAQLQKHLHE
jgi:hypothetical protein